MNLIYDPQGAATEETLEIPIDFVVEEGAIIGGTGILPVLSSYAERAGRPFP